MRPMTAVLMPPPGMMSGTSTRQPVRAAKVSARSLLLVRLGPKASQTKRIVEREAGAVEVEGGVAMYVL